MSGAAMSYFTQPMYSRPAFHSHFLNYYSIFVFTFILPCKKTEFETEYLLSCRNDKGCFLEQHCSKELSVILEYYTSALFSTVATGHIWLLSMKTVTSET